MKVFFTGGGGAGNEAVWRLIGERYELHFGDADRDAIDPTIPPDRRHQIPWASDPAFATAMAALCRRLGIDLLVPAVDEELLVLADEAPSFAPTRLLLPSADYVRTMTDKLDMIEALAARRLPVPRSQSLAFPLENIALPCIVKPRHGRGSRDVTTVADAVALDALRLRLGARAADMVAQERIEGVEYTVQMVADASARLHAIVPVRVDVKRGITIRASTHQQPAVRAACRAIHAAVPTTGCYNIQLMLTPDGRCLPFEINPRVSTTFCMTIAAGIDPIGVFLENTAPRAEVEAGEGVELRRHWRNHFNIQGL